MNINGNLILLSLADDLAVSGTTVTVLAGQTSGSIEVQKELIEYTSKTTVEGGIPVRKYIPTRSTSTINVDSLYDPSGDMDQEEVFEMCYNGKLIRFSVGTGVAGSKVITGKGYISSASSTFDMDSSTSASFSIQVDGGLTFGTVAGG